MDLRGRHVAVLGGSSGIGRATAALLAEHGARVTVTGRSAERLAQVAGELGASAEQVDATDRAALDALFSRVGPVDDLVVCVSGGEGGGRFATLELAGLRRAFAAKTFAQLEVVQAALPVLADRASITLVTAGSAQSALAGTAGLAAVNGALEAAVRPLATELAPRRVNAVSPGVVDTPWWSGLPDADRAAVFTSTAERLPVGRVGRAEEIAQAIAALIGNGFITGQVLVADGGGHLAR